MAAHQEQINLLPQKGFESTVTGRILVWLLSTFRTIVIVTEIIVMVAFLSRFWFDARNTDLNDKIEQKKAILAASQDFELRFKDVQKRLKIYSELAKNEGQNSNLISTVTENLPSDIVLVEIEIETDVLRISGITANEKSIEQIIVNLDNTQILKETGLSEIKTSPNNPQVLEFIVEAKLEKYG